MTSSLARPAGDLPIASRFVSHEHGELGAGERLEGGGQTPPWSRAGREGHRPLLTRMASSRVSNFERPRRQLWGAARATQENGGVGVRRSPARFRRLPKEVKDASGGHA